MLTSTITKTNTLRFAITLCRALIVSIVLEQSLQHSHPDNYFHPSRKKKDIGYQILLDDLLDIYFGLVILQKRIEGDLPACEGILVVKEKL